MYSIVSLDGVNIDENGRILVSNTPPLPPHTTPVNILYYGQHNGTEWNAYEIPVGKLLTIQRLIGGSGGLCKIEIRDRGLDDNQWELVSAPLFISGATINTELDIEISASPTGSRWIEMLIINKRNQYSTGQLIGYLKDL